ncbi:LSU ribosomal protein L10P [Quadrisphaera granulorum]|uniref:Large ribosomal subunit protein uL10 n=1 Tax=Quadrisphaera granulorum TaxID=317664 RepID=A0A316ACM4_9ACTN|nr:50S ribosomal protein L10 [Quadrisphaera granulorum]PWJ55483.1 LSU ribosomal protein L10P [Quadrisphaera granulorum]SZE95547.1 LSU ribosomal protein L10P [Quadrisphaera granulorum]
MPTAEKEAAVAELTELFREANAGVLTEYRGLTVAQLKQLRRAIGDHGSYNVVKNTLTAIAAKNAGVDAFDGQLAGPTAIAFITGDPVEAAKGLRAFAKTNPALVIKSGFLEGKPLTAAEVSALADLEPREVLLAKMAGALKGSLNRAAYVFNAPLSKAARTVDALRAKVEAGTPAASDAPAADEAAPAADEA